jgi:hypothetical protein
MKSFWEGFEKKAISAAAWLRAAEGRVGRVRDLLPSTAHGGSEHYMQWFAAHGPADKIRSAIQAKHPKLFYEGKGYRIGEIPKDLRAADLKKEVGKYTKRPRFEDEKKLMESHDSDPGNFRDYPSTPTSLYNARKGSVRQKTTKKPKKTRAGADYKHLLYP